MKISVNDQELFTLSETQKKVIRNDIHDEIFDEDMKRRLHWVLMHKYERCMERLMKEWIVDKDASGKCKAERCGLKSIPVNKDELAEAIFALPEYKCRSQRDTDERQAK